MFGEKKHAHNAKRNTGAEGLFVAKGAIIVFDQCQMFSESICEKWLQNITKHQRP